MLVSSSSVTNLNVSEILIPDRFGKVDASYGCNTTGIEIMTITPSVMNGKMDFTMTLWLKYFKTYGNVMSMANSTIINELTFH